MPWKLYETLPILPHVTPFMSMFAVSLALALALPLFTWLANHVKSLADPSK